jgi:predicted nucleotidyltransferase
MNERSQNILNEIRRTLSSEETALEDRKVVLFGSRAQGTERERSDFDIGILGSKPLSPRDFFRLQEKIERIETLFRIDLVDLATVSEQFRGEALKHTEVLIG